ncbi:MAG: glycosyltransferase [Aliifodinibius sp.]|nr:glycosyltransferase family 2 protein [Nitrosopumilaceae archaeon]NIV12231.1 glycosyltransferase [Fodinibius sp.]NIX60151.1 glycosyltransferase [Nitrosopumilaceae archaeon]
MNISIIIPTFNEADSISETIEKIRRHSNDHILEIIIVDGGSNDATIDIAKATDVKTFKSPEKGRATQMNFGAKQATGEILYFLHADTHPPNNFDNSINKAVKRGYHAGCFQLTFDNDHFLLRLYGWFTRFNIDLFRFGDQSLFIKKDTFHKLKGFRKDHIVMEDQEFIRRIKQKFSFVILDEYVITSAQKYRDNGILKLQLVFTLILLLYYMGIGQDKLVKIYNWFTN